MKTMRTSTALYGHFSSFGQVGEKKNKLENTRELLFIVVLGTQNEITDLLVL